MNYGLFQKYEHGRRCFTIIYRHCTQKSTNSMHTWQAYGYGTPDVLQLTSSAKIPTLAKPSDILVKVHAASVNPIDVMMLKGYGASTFGAWRKLAGLASCNPVSDFPLTFGRDFSGTVVRTGGCVKSIKPGDEVWGVVNIEYPGSHAEYVTTSACYVSKKPVAINSIEASSMPYAALTAYSALSTFGGLTKKSTYGKRVLVLGASGGVGTMAVQILKAWGADVTAVCSTDAVELVAGLMVDQVIDYQLQDVQSELKSVEKFDFILDAVGSKDSEQIRALDILKKWKNSKFVTIVSPTLKNSDDYGLALGTVKSVAEATRDTLMGLKDGHSMRWAYVVPNGCALKTISEMVDQKQVVPVIDKVFEFGEAPEAYKKVLDGHARGKTVISHIDIPEEYKRSHPVADEQIKMEETSENVSNK